MTNSSSDTDMNNSQDRDHSVPHLTFLKRLVTVLTLTMIAGITILVTLVFIRFQDATPKAAFPSQISLSDGTTPVAFTQTKDWYAIITEENNILIYDRTGALIQSIPIKIQN